MSTNSSQLALLGQSIGSVGSNYNSAIQDLSLMIQNLVLSMKALFALASLVTHQAIHFWLPNTLLRCFSSIQLFTLSGSIEISA